MRYTEKERLAFARNGLWLEGEIIIHDTAVIDPSATIGKDGFGFVRDENNELVAMPHAGGVFIEANVSIGAHTCVDRAVNGYTSIEHGSKIDNLVHVGHGAKIGKHCLIVAGSVLGGSCEIGDYSFIGMNASIKNKVKIGKNVIIGAGSVILKDVPDNEVWIGNPGRFLRKT